MSCSNALKYDISVNPSVYGGVTVFILYVCLVFFFLAVVELTWLSLVFSLILLIMAGYAGYKFYARTYTIKLNDAAQVAVLYRNKLLISGDIGPSSFYNGFCLCLHLQSNSNELSNLITRKKTPEKFIMIYKDAVKADEYRLLARLINLGH
ncbi:MAG: hypothetical protein WBM99_08005 [Psychromonas sp.]